MGQYLSYPTIPSPEEKSSSHSIKEIIKRDSRYGNSNFRPADWVPCNLCGRPIRKHNKKCSLHPDRKSAVN